MFFCGHYETIVDDNGALELSKVPVEMLLGDLDELDILKELDVSLE